MRQLQSRGLGINLLETDDSSNDPALDFVSSSTLPSSPIPPAAKRAIILEKAEGVPTQVVAAKFDVHPEAVGRIWREWCASMRADLGRLGDEADPARFRSRIRTKAANAIENGLDYDRDPYRQGSLGVAVMKGIGEFRADNADASRVNELLNSVPADWKGRYISIKNVNVSITQVEVKDKDHDDQER